jgi:hypothetical protein
MEEGAAAAEATSHRLRAAFLAAFQSKGLLGGGGGDGNEEEAVDEAIVVRACVGALRDAVVCAWWLAGSDRSHVSVSNPNKQTIGLFGRHAPRD